MSEELKPCPFCGGDAEIERMGSGRQSMIYACTDCGCRLETSETFIGPHCSWNTRASTKPPLAVTDEMMSRARAAFGATEQFKRYQITDGDLRAALTAALKEVP